MRDKSRAHKLWARSTQKANNDKKPHTSLFNLEKRVAMFVKSPRNNEK